MYGFVRVTETDEGWWMILQQVSADYKFFNGTKINVT